MMDDPAGAVWWLLKLSAVAACQVPEHFLEDLFAVLGEDARPDYRWAAHTSCSTCLLAILYTHSQCSCLRALTWKRLLLAIPG